MTTTADRVMRGPTAAPNKWLVATAVTVGTLMGTVDASVVNVALPSIQATFGVSITEVTWLTTSYLIALVLLLPLTGWLVSVFGRKPLYQACLLVFIGASVFAGLAPSLPLLIAARVLQGLGAGILNPVEQAILSETFPPEQRGLATGLYGLVVVLGPTIGPLVGGWITDNMTWRWIFFINVPVGLLGSLLVASFVPEPAHIKQPGRVKVDAVGIGLLAVGLSSLLVVLEQGNRWDWFSSPLVWGFGLAAVSSLLLFVLWELLGTETPAVDLRILTNRAFTAAWASVGVLGLALIGALLLQSLFLQEVLGYTATQTGTMFVPRGLVTMIMSPIAGLLLNRVGPRVLAAAGGLSVAAALFMMSRWTLDAGLLQILPPMMLNGLGLAMLFIPLFNAGIASVDRRKITGAAGLLSLQLQLGAAFGSAILATMIERGITRYHAILVEHATPASPAFSATLQQLTQLLSGPGGRDSVTAQQQAYAMLDQTITAQASVLSFNHAFQIIAAIALIVLLCVPFLRRPTANLPH